MMQDVNWDDQNVDWDNQGPEMAQDGQVNYNDGLQTEEGTPVAQIIAMSFNTIMYFIIAFWMITGYSKVPIWKKIFAATLTCP